MYKSYGSTIALEDVSLEVSKGELVVLVGPNGSGKTTLLRILLGLLRPDRGEVSVMGYTPWRMPVRARMEIGYAPERDILPSWLTVKEYLEVVAEAKEAKVSEAPLEMLGLQRVVAKRISSLSQGYRKRVQLAAALIGNPKLLVLDEPYSNVDVETRIVVDRILEEYRGKATIILATHVEPAIGIDKLLVLVSGKLVAVYSGRELRPRYILKCGEKTIEVDNEEKAETLIRRGCSLVNCVKETLTTIFTKVSKRQQSRAKVKGNTD